jgi:hypothetical protein
MSNKIQIIDLLPISDEDIAKNNVGLSDLWMVKSADQMYGPYDTQSLKTYSASQEELFFETDAYNLETEIWKPFYQIGQFQRRKPKLVKVQSLSVVDQFLILENGIKKGPVSLEKIQEMADSKKIPLNIQVSTDKGETWIKLFEHHEFDRRLEKNKEELPFVPDQNIFDEEAKNIKQKLVDSLYSKDEEDAIVGLAFIGNGNDSGQEITLELEERTINPNKIQKVKSYKKIKRVQVNQSFFEQLQEKFNLKYASMTVVGIFVLFSVVNSFNGSFNNSNKEIKLQKSVKVTQPFSEQTQVQRKPAKVIRAKKFKPVKRKAHKPRANRKPVRTYKEVHTDERYDTVDIDDPNIKEELTRQLAGGYGDDELSPDEIEFIEKAERDGLSEDDLIRLENQENDGYQQVQDFD